MSVGWRVTRYWQRKRHNLRKLQGQIRAGGDKERHLNCIRMAVELAFGVTVKLEQFDLLWSTERIGSLSRKRDMKECTASFLPHVQLYSYYAAAVKCHWCGAVREHSEASTC